jgi:2-oxoglutarate dehydrogenase E1 component
VQEEPKNQGGWSYIEPRFRSILLSLGKNAVNIPYAGRPVSAATATGYSKNHTEELNTFLREAMK